MTPRPEGGALAKFFAKGVVRGFPGSANAKKAAVDEVQLAERTTEVLIETQIAGSSFLKAYIIDPEWALIVSGWLKVTEGMLEPIEVEFPEGSKWHWILCAVEGSYGNVSDANLVVTFEDRIVYFLRQYYGTKHVPPGVQTRAQFIHLLVKEIGSRGEPKAGFICPSLNIVQPIETEGEAEKHKTKTALDKQEEEEKKAKLGGLGTGSIVIKGVPATRQQAADVSTALQVAQKLHAPPLAIEALIVAGIGESTFTRSENTSGHMGVWQSNIIPANEVAKQAEFFLKGGESFQAGGAIKLSRQQPPLTPGDIATKVEASGEAGSFYEAYIAEARKIISESGVTSGGTTGSSEENVSGVGQLQRGTSSNPDEDSFECASRLASQVDWFFFSDNHNFFYMDGPDLKKQKPALYLDIPRNHIKYPHESTGKYGLIHSPSTFNFDNCLALDTPIPTPAGWTTMGELEIGDIVFGSDGTPVKVLRVLPIQNNRDCYKVKFNDGSEIVTDAGHLWETRSVRHYPEKALDNDAQIAWHSTTEIAESLYGYNKSPTRRDYNHRVKTTQPLDLPGRPLPVDPYILGYWLGDGRSACPIITTSANDYSHLIEQIDRAEYAHMTRTEAKSSLSRNLSLRVSISGISLAMKDLGVINDKHIPTEYLRSSPNQRLALLQGLMDSDGCISKHCALWLTNEKLAHDAMDLLHGLGFRINRNENPPRGIGRKIQYGTTFSVRDHVNVFRLPRKASLYARRVEEISYRRSHCAHRTITDVVTVSSVPVRCIEVDAEDHLFLAGKAMIPTRNTTFQYRISHKLKTRVQRKSKSVKPATPAEVKLLIECDINQFHAGQAFKIENSGPADGVWIVTNTRRNSVKDIYTEIILEPPIEPLPEPKGTAEGAEAAGGGANVEGYTNPFAQVKNLSPSRIDMGVDYSGGGFPVAIGDAEVTFSSNHTGWEGGGAVVYKLTSGAYSGKHIYIAENIVTTIEKGAKLKAGQPFCTMTGGIETGWASGNEDGALAASLGQQAPGDPGGWESQAGQSFNRFLVSLGVPSGTKNSGGAGKGGQAMPAGYP